MENSVDDSIGVGMSSNDHSRKFSLVTVESSEHPLLLNNTSSYK